MCKLRYSIALDTIGTQPDPTKLNFSFDDSASPTSVNVEIINSNVLCGPSDETYTIIILASAGTTAQSTT